jgi:hypothetical protein
MRWAASRSIFVLFIIRCLPAVRHTAVTRKTELLIEGFPRSGNTFARNAFLHACNNQCVLSSHLHFIANVKRAIQLNKPVLILIRNPIDAVASYLIYEGDGFSAEQAMREYIDFYSYVLRCRDHVVLATFTEVTESFDRVIERINHHFESSFPPFEHTEENVQACINQALGQKSPWRATRKKWSSERNASSPVEGRDELKKAVRNQIENDPDVTHLMLKAQQIFSSLTE